MRLIILFWRGPRYSSTPNIYPKSLSLILWFDSHVGIFTPCIMSPWFLKCPLKGPVCSAGRGRAHLGTPWGPGWSPGWGAECWLWCWRSAAGWSSRHHSPGSWSLRTWPLVPPQKYITKRWVITSSSTYLLQHMRWCVCWMRKVCRAAWPTGCHRIWHTS